jgi:hypothetical protein
MKKTMYICSATLVLLNAFQIGQALYLGASPASYLYLGLISSLLLVVALFSGEG